MYTFKIVPIFIFCFFFDYLLKSDILLQNRKGSKSLSKAICDNVGHGLIAVSTWLVVIDYKFSMWNVTQLVLCGLAGSIIDIDHFIHARSFLLKVSKLCHYIP